VVSAPEVLMEGVVFGESPRWHDGQLWFSDWGANQVIALDADGSHQVVVTVPSIPMCIDFLPDGRLLVAESYGNRLTGFDIGADGVLSNRRVWADLGEDHPDGICLDAEGAVWAADVGNKHCVRVGEGGQVLQTVDADRGCFACTLGGADGRTLYIVTAQWPNDFRTPTGQVLAVQVTVPSARSATAGR
jgi:sugar lactone lactonase YvrE